MRLYINLGLAVLVLMTLGSATAKASMHSARAEVNVDHIHLTQYMSYADRSGAFRFGGTVEGLTDEYEPTILLQRPVYEAQVGRKVWRNVSGIGGVGAFRQPTEHRYSYKLRFNARIRERISHLRARAPLRILVEIDTYNLFTRHWAVAQSLTLAL